MLDYHDVPQPVICDVCAYSEANPSANNRLEHTITRIATAAILEDLREAGGGPLSLIQMAVSGIGEPGPVTRIDPRHWFWALMTERRIGLVLR